MLFAPPVGLMVRRDHPDEDGHIQTTLINVPEDHVLVSLGDPCVGVQHVLDQSFIKQASEYEVCYRLSACRPLETKTDSDYVGSSTGSSDEEVAFEAASVG